MELEEALRRRRMVRSFSGRPVDRPVLDEILRAALRAPTAGNTDGWDVVVLEGGPDTLAFWEATTTPEWRARSRRWPGLSRAPVVACLFADPHAYLERYDEPDKSRSGLGTPELGGGGEQAWRVPFWFVDAGFAAFAMLLAATDAGLGACFLGNFRGEQALARRLGVPAGRRYLGAVLLGEPGGTDPPSPSRARPKRTLADVVHRTRW